MSIFKTAYDTTIGSSENTKEICLKLKEAFITDMIYEKNLGYDLSPNYKLCFVDGSDTSEEYIPQIVHPLLFEHSTKSSNKFICTDIRMFVNPRQFEAGSVIPAVKNYGEFNLAVDKAALQLMWLDGLISPLRDDLDFGGVVFANWLTDVIAKRFALDGRDQLMLTVVSFLYYQSLFINSAELTNEARETSYIKLTSALRIPREIVEYVMSKDNLSFLDVTDYCNTVRMVLENIRLKDFNLGVLVTLIGNSWFGVNANKTLAVAIEHPPTWLAVIGLASNYKGYKNTTIAKTIEKVNKRGGLQEFTSAYNNILSFKNSN